MASSEGEHRTELDESRRYFVAPIFMQPTNDVIEKEKGPCLTGIKRWHSKNRFASVLTKSTQDEVARTVKNSTIG